MKRPLLIYASLCGTLLAGGACGRDRGESAQPGQAGDTPASVDRSWNPQGVTQVMGVPAAQVRAAIQSRVAGARPAPLEEDQWTHVRRLYARYGQGPLWLGNDGLVRDRAAALMNALIDAQNDALNLDAYPLNDLARAVSTIRSTKNPTPQQLAEADVLLTSAYAALGEDLLTGQVDPRTVSQDWHIDPQEEHVDSALVRALREEPLDSSLARMRPQDDDYAALRRELQQYRQIAGRGDWPKVPSGKDLKPGQSDSPARLAALRSRLQAEGLLAAAPAATAPAPAAEGQQQQGRTRGQARGGGVYDAQLAGAVAQFQARHGIEADSVLGAGTVASLNTPPGYRLGQVAANLERFRWLPRSFGSRYILVNVPAFRLEAYDAGKKALEMKVIVGAEFEDRTTPVFSDSMEYVVFRPYWLVTDSIAIKEVFPKAQADPGYLAQNNYELYQEKGKTRVRQKPGPKNSLGLIKFMFPNDFNIYLHDTPADSLFQKDVRAFSHGCIRLEKPDQLAHFVLGWSPEKIRQAMDQPPDDKRVSLPRRIPVYIAYFTAYFRDGQPYFGNDLYKRDDALIRAVTPGALPNAQTLRTIESLRRLAG